MSDRIISFERSADEWMMRARKSMMEGDVLSGIRYYRKAMDLAGSHPFILLEMGYAYFSFHCYETVEHLIHTYMESAPRFGESELDGEWCHLAAITAMNRNDEALSLAGLRAYRFLDPEGAQKRGVDELLGKYPWQKSTPPPRAARAYTLLRQAGNDVSKLLRAVKRDPTGHSAVRAASFLAVSDPEYALRLIHTAQQKGMPDWDRFRCYLTLAKAYAMIGHLPEARVAWNTASDLCNRFDRLESMVRGAMEIRQHAWAQELLDEWADGDHTSVSVLKFQILLSQSIGDTRKEALARIRLKKLDPWHPLHTESFEQAEQTLTKKRSMIQSRISPFARAYAAEGDKES